MRRRHLAAAATIAALALALVGCGSKNNATGSQAGTGGTTSKKLAPLTLNPSQVVAASAVKTLMAGSAKMSMTLDVTSAAKTTTITSDGAFDFLKHRGVIVLHLAQVGDVQAIFDNGVVYEKLGTLLKSGKPWIKIDLTKLLGQSAGLSSADQTGGDPSQSLAYVFGATGVAKVGSDSVRGVATSHYRGTLDLAKATQRLSPQFRTFYQKLLESTGTKVSSGLPADLWIDGQGRLRRLSYTIKVAAGSLGASTTKSTVDYYAFGTPVSIQLPPADQVASFTG